MDAPREMVGSTISDWVVFFGPAYQIADVTSRRSGHDDSPEIVLSISDGQTTEVRFVVNPATNRQSLIQVRSASPDFLTYLGVDTLNFDSDGRTALQNCGEDYCDRFRATRMPNGDIGATWEYAWD